MKQIIPFKKELLFKTKVSEITSISLEHTLTLKNEDLISGEFYITGDYKMTEGSINREKFEFHLPFDITLDSRYDISSIMIDIDNFYYEIINNESLQVNIDVYIEGDKIIEEPPQEETPVPQKESITPIENNVLPMAVQEESAEKVLYSENDDNLIRKASIEEEPEPIEEEPIDTRNIHDLFKDQSIEKAVEYQQPAQEILAVKKNITENDDFNIFDNIDNSDTYVTYYVYIVKETDTIESIMSKYNVSKDDIALYNNLENVKPGHKLIIPSTNE